MKYKTGIMSSVMELEANNIDEAICVTMLKLQSQAPIAVYDTEETSTLSFPYDPDQVDRILKNMGNRLKDVFDSIRLKD